MVTDTKRSNAHTHTHIHTYIHTHIHTYIHFFGDIGRNKDTGFSKLFQGWDPGAGWQIHHYNTPSSCNNMLRSGQPKTGGSARHHCTNSIGQHDGKERGTDQEQLHTSKMADLDRIVYAYLKKRGYKVCVCVCE